MEYLCGFLFVVGLITLVGHGIWVALAAIGRALGGGGAPPRPAPAPGPARGKAWCPGCDGSVSPLEETCPYCRLDLGGLAADRLRNLDAARRVILALASDGELDSETAARLTTLFARRRKRFLARGPAAEPPRGEPAVVRVPPHYPAVPAESVVTLEAVAADEPVAPPPVPVGSPTVPGPAPARADALAVEPAAAPRRPLGDVLVGFMAERNILWGELVGGLLIVGCSIALVLTLWNSLQELPYFPFLLFSTITAALFSAGLYTLHHWKLEATSRGLLAIALMLAPLNVLVLADPSARGGLPATGWLHPCVVALSLLLFGLMARAAGRDLIGADLLPGPVDRRWLFALAIVGTAGTQLLTPALLPDGGAPSVGLFLALAAVPGACYLLTTGAVLGGLTLYGRRDRELTVAGAHALFTFLGLAVFALLAALAFLQSRSVLWRDTLPALALPLALSGIPGLVGGLLVHRRLLGQDDAGTRTAGTAVTLAGLVVMLAGLGLAWPQPVPMLIVALVNAATLTAAAFRGRIAWLHAGGVSCLALGVVLAVQLALAGGAFPGAAPAAWLVERLGSASSGLTLAVLVAGLAGLAIRLDRGEGAGHARALAAGAVGLAVAALFIATARGPGAPRAAASVYALLTLTALASCAWRPRHWLAQPGAWLLLPAGLWALEAFLPGLHLVWGIALAGAGVVLLLAAALLADRNHPVRIAMQSAGPAAGVLGLGLTASSVRGPIDPLAALPLGLVAAQAFLLAWQLRRAILSGAGSFLALAALFVLVWRLGGFSPPGSAAVALLGHATLATAAAWLLGGRRGEVVGVFAAPLHISAEACSLVAVPFILLPGEGLAWQAGCCLWAAALWLERAWRGYSPLWFTLMQAGVSAAALFAVRAVVDDRGWLGGTPGVVDPRVLQLYGTALALLGLIWVGLRRVGALRPLWPTDANSLDRVLTGLLVAGQLLLLVFHAGPSMAAEWFPGFSFDQVPWWTAETFALPGWLCLGSLAALVVAGLHGRPAAGQEAFRSASVGALVVLAVSAVLLWAGGFSEERATASALRWGLAVVFGGGAAVLWNRDRLGRLAGQGGFAVGAGPGRPDRIDLVIRRLVGLTGVAVFLLSAMVANLGFAGLKLGGPAAGTLFARLGFTLSNVGPLALLVLGLSGSALRERSAGYAFLACLLATLSVTAGYALAVDGVGLGEGLFLWLLAVQTASVGALCWLGAGRRLPAGPLLSAQGWLGLGGMVVLALAPLAGWLIDPASPIDGAFHVIGRLPGWSALGLAVVASFGHARRHAPARQADAVGVAGLLVGVLVGCLALAWDGPGLWRAFTMLTVSWCYLGGLAVAGGFLLRPTAISWPAGFSPGRVCGWLTVVGAALCLAALRGAEAPWRPWLPAGAALVAAAVFAAGALWFRRGGFSYASGLAVVLAGWLVHLALGQPTLSAFLLALGLSLAVASALWSLPRLRDGVPFSGLAAPLALVVAGCAVAGALAADLEGAPLALPGWLAWTTLCAVGGAFYLERHAPIARPGLFVLLLTASGLALHGLGLEAKRLPWAGGLALALDFTLAAGVARRYKEEAERERGWFVPAQLGGAAVVALLAVGACLGAGPLGERLAGPLMLLLLVPGGWFLAGVSRLRWLAPAALAAAVAAVAWAVPAGGGAAVWLERNAWLLLALAATAAAYLEWTPSAPEGEAAPSEGRAVLGAARGVGRVSFGLALVAALVVVAQMVPLVGVLTRRTPLSGPGVVAVFTALAGLLVCALRVALGTGREPLGLSERGRRLYVYLAEGLLLLAFIHARLNVPELFTGFLARYWTLIVMLIAFVGVGLSELFERRGLGVLAVPLQRTAVFLPVIPILAFWARPPEGLIAVARDRAPGLVPVLENQALAPWNFDSHALVWFLAGGVYLLLAGMRRSPGWALAAALAANCALWAVWTHAGVAFYSHPQVWLIPLGLIVLVAEHLERGRLAPEQAAALRYLGVCVVYVASTAELFITGLGNSLWLPVVLAVLCVAGVLGGIWLRVKAFLFLGVSFLLLDVVTMIWHAAVNRAHTWVWWASGIVLGMAILALFALFEKRRNDVLRLLAELRRWA